MATTQDPSEIARNTAKPTHPSPPPGGWGAASSPPATSSTQTRNFASKPPRNLSGAELAKARARVGYVVSRQKGSHIGLTTRRNGGHHVTVPNHNPIKVGTLAGILRDVAEHLYLDRDALLEEMFA
jgi:predicted RNA binding protein YcfA (HicA-like mRNA interferase family)